LLTVRPAGGPKIITQVLLALIGTLDLQQDLQTAISTPRFHHQWQPDSVLLESKVPKEIVAGLKTLGHKIETIDASGVAQGIAKNAADELVGVHDPRVPGKAGSVVREIPE